MSNCLPTVAVAGDFCRPVERQHCQTSDETRASCLVSPGALLAQQRVALAIRLSIASTVLMLAVSAAMAVPCAAQDANALARTATAAIEDHRFGDALDAFTKAAAMRPKDASLCFGAGIAAFMLGQNDVAQTRFECALAINPAHVQAALWLGDLHYRAGRLREAISVYETAGQHSPKERELQDQLARWRKEHELQSRFLEARTEHFTALFETAADEPLARAMLERLEAAYWRVGRALGVYPSEPVTVVLYSREQFADITKLAAWSAAAYDGRIRVPIGSALAQPDELDRVLSHEFVHAVVAMLGGRAVPAWMNEGLATALEPSGRQDADRALPSTAPRPALSTLHRGFVDFSTRDAEIAYASAAHAVRRLIDARGMGCVVALLQDLGRGAPFDSAFHQRVAMRYEDFAALLTRD
jgi:Flp pilus assembly protein TadD